MNYFLFLFMFALLIIEFVMIFGLGFALSRLAGICVNLSEQMKALQTDPVSYNEPPIPHDKPQPHDVGLNDVTGPFQPK